MSFDFQINPYRFGGSFADVTSTPYPVTALDSFETVVEGAFPVRFLGFVEEFTSSSQALGGTVRSILVTVQMPRDELDSVMAVARNGSLIPVLVTATMPPDEINSTGSRALEGAIRAVLIVANMPTDSFNSVTAVATGGTLQ